MIWEKREVDPQEVRLLAKRYGMDLLVASILVRRSMTDPESICFFLEDDPQLLHNPFLFKSMETTVERINAAIESGEQIAIFGDRDVDGVTSTVLLYKTLNELGARVDWLLPEGEEDYGLSPTVIERIAERGTDLLITVDCGVTNNAEIALAGEKGIETIVIDHHNPQENLPPALAVVDPKIMDSGYPFRDLAGCGVVSKVDWALRFSRTFFYGQSFCLLTVRPANETYVVEALKLYNLVESERISESFVPGLVDFRKTRLSRFVEGEEVLVLDGEWNARLLAKIFGTDISISLSDLAPLVKQYLSELAGKSLLKILDQGKIAKYSAKQAGELDALKELFISLVLKREEAALKPVSNSMDLVALGTIADLMPLMNENRIFVKQGLKAMNRFERHGLKELFFRKDLLGKRISSIDIAWQITPLINSAGRMGEPEKAIMLLLSEVASEIQGLVEYLIGLDRQRKSLGEEVWNTIIPKAKRSFEKTGGRCVLILDRSLQRGITGIMASRLQSFFKAPAVVVALLDDRAVGSIRCPADFAIQSFFDQFSDVFTNFGGHACAGGFSMPAAKIDEFSERFDRIALTFKSPQAEEEVLAIDAEIPVSYLTPEIKKVAELFDPHGEGNQPLVFMTRKIRIASYELIGRKELVHLKMLFDTGKFKWPAVFWNGADRVGKDFQIGDQVDIAYRLTKNSFNNMEILQLNILDVKR